MAKGQGEGELFSFSHLQEQGEGEWDGEVASPFLILPTTVFQI